MKKIAIIGSEGYVGKAFAKMFEGRDDYEIIKYDIQHGELTDEIKDNINTANLGVVCVWTPTDLAKYNEGVNGCNTKYVNEVIDWLETPVILIKSTVEIGTTQALIDKYKKRIVMSPEYIGEGKYFVPPEYEYNTDMKKTPWVILGGDNDDCNYILDLLVPVLGATKQYIKVTATEAEVVKYMENAYFGLKVAFVNEMYDLVNALGCDWYRVWQAWATDNRVGKMHTAVFKDNRGFGGKCLPKDINALVYTAVKHINPVLLKAILKSNDIQVLKNDKDY